ncbi:hypothetical protein POTOM_044415 [Populus tomentosa]|uniref:Uncharacterized protein n=1 Tax=Populus tomentosa TaxID=118781 RepID=A0A8X8CEI5_POPTO|nr:hypothetical protein POTOM_044415 [Populus tomentosa]
MASGAEDDAAVEAGDGCVLVQDSEKSCLFGMLSKAPDAACGSRFWLVLREVAGPGKMCFGFENGDGKGSVRLKNGDGELTERGVAAFLRRDGDGGTAERGMGVLVKGRGDSGLRLLR